METKEARLGLIQEILESRSVPSQEVLVELLQERGFSVTQSSVSRDLRDLRVAKVAGQYQLPESLRSPRALALDGITGVQRAGPHLTIVHTVVGGASRVALGLDQSGWPEVVGTIAGDDTIFVATADAAEQAALIAKLCRLTATREEMA